MLTQVEMAQSIYDNGGRCFQLDRTECRACPLDKLCLSLPGYITDKHMADRVRAAKEFIKPPTSYLNTKTRRKPAFARPNDRIRISLRRQRT